jgi:flagellar biosynthetic protein FliP
MLLQSMGILAALAFVLGLVAVAMWVAKRFGGATTSPRSRVVVEIVQRVPFGPKAAMAVVRVGEKVMAVSIGPDGIRPLFELDEADRQRVIATSQVSVPFASTAEAGRALSKLLPRAFGGETLARLFGTPGSAVESLAPAFSMSPSIGAEIPAFFAEHLGGSARGGQASALGTSGAATVKDREFQGMLNIALSGATRLAVFVGVVGAARIAHAQTVPVTPPVTTSGTTVAPSTISPAATPAATSTAIQPSSATATPLVTAPAPPVPIVGPPPAYIVPKGVSRAPRTATVRPAVPRMPVKSGAAQRGADSVLAAGARGAAKGALPGATPTTVQTTAAAAQVQAALDARNGRASSAPPAPVAGGEDALSKMIPQMDLRMGDEKGGGLRLNGTVGIVVMMGLLTLIPTLLLMMTGFTRILIVLHFLKQAMGTQAAPPAQLLSAMALLLTGFVMAPTLREVNRTALEPWMNNQITQVQMLETGVKPFRAFMERQTRPADLKTFIGLSRLPRPNTVDDVPLHVLMSAFVASELRTSFQIGFTIYLPFIVIDAVVASVLMSMGMFMLPPAMISMPFKLLLFVLVDGWGLTINALVQSFK